MSQIKRLQADVERARAESSALRTGLLELRTYAYSDKYRSGEPGIDPADVILRVDETLSAGGDAALPPYPRRGADCEVTS